MALETYKYFQPDTSLRASYGGGAIQAAADSAEIAPYTLTTRHIFKNIDFLSTKTKHLCTVGTASSVVLFEISDSLYPSISSLLSASELATVTSTRPTGFTITTSESQLQLSPTLRNIIIMGDSLSEGLNSASGKRGIYAVKAIESLDNVPATFSESDRIVKTANYQIINLALSSSSWANTVGDVNITTYPLRWDLAFNQRVRTLNIKPSDVLFLWLGTNDLAQDVNLTPAQNWSRASARVSEILNTLDCKIVLATTIKRSQNVASNDKINEYNNLIRDNWVAIGVDAICDFESLVSQVNIQMGVAGDLVYYSDPTHLTDLGQATLAPVFADVISRL